MSLEKKRSTAWAVLAVWVPLGLGCIIVNPGANNEPEPDPPIENEECTNDHDTFFLPDEDGAEISRADRACNTISYYSGGGGQGGGAAIFHIEPKFEVTNPDLWPEEQPFIVWKLRQMDTGEVYEEQGFELFDADIRDEPNGGWSVISQFIVGPEARGKNYRIEAEMEAVDGDGNIVTLTPAAAVFLETDAGASTTF